MYLVSNRLRLRGAPSQNPPPFLRRAPRGGGGGELVVGELEHHEKRAEADQRLAIGELVVDLRA